MPLNINDKAPDFSLVTMTENGPEVYTLSENLGSKSILLLFVPMAFTSVCTDEFCEITNQLNDYVDLNADVVGISGDSPFAQAEWANKEGIGIPLLSDYEHTAAKDYDVAYEAFLPEKNLIMGGVAKRSAFVVDKDGVIKYAEVLDNPRDVPNFEAIKSVLAE